jgi:hypothetical protein
MLIIVSREHEGLYKGLKARQEANGRDWVLLDRRNGERRRADASSRDAERRLPLSDAERALMNVLGFTVLHREIQVIRGQRRLARTTALRGLAKAPTRPARHSRRRAAS